MLSALAFCVIGLSSAASGGGYTEDARCNTASKYRVSYKHPRVAAMAQVVAPTGAFPRPAHGVVGFLRASRYRNVPFE